MIENYLYNLLFDISKLHASASNNFPSCLSPLTLSNNINNSPTRRPDKPREFDAGRAEHIRGCLRYVGCKLAIHFVAGKQDTHV